MPEIGNFLKILSRGWWTRLRKSEDLNVCAIWNFPAITYCLTFCILTVHPELLLNPKLPKRDDPRFDTLRCVGGHVDTFLKGLENTIIHLPDLCLYPKGFDATILLDSTILTPQRLDILRHFAKLVHLGVPDREMKSAQGIILSGPNGVGKSIISYMLACTAFVNGCILVYIPMAGDWIKGKAVKYHSLFLRSLLSYNAPILASLPSQTSLKSPKPTLLDLACKDESLETYHGLVNELKLVKVPI